MHEDGDDSPEMSQDHTNGTPTNRSTDDGWGILAAYHDSFGDLHETTTETRDALLRAMRLNAADPTVTDVPDVRVLGPDETMALSRPAELVLEDGTTLKLQDSVPPDLPLGYHDLMPADGRSPTMIIKSPGRCYLEPNLRIWGWAVQLYAARSSKSWGFGDFADLRRLGHWSAGLGAGAVLVNPLSAVAPVLPQQSSPYFPSSRRFHNPLYLRIEEVPGAADMGIDLEHLAATGRQLNEHRRIDRDQVFRLKMQALEVLWERRGGDALFDSFLEQRGESLRSFAAFCVLAEQFGGDWREWPGEYRRADSSAVSGFVEANADRLRFHAWLQWLLDEQLASAAQELPLVQDLPIGVDPGGADAWQWQDVLADGASVGAPPDEFNTLGQDWCLPPFIPHRLRGARFGPFIETIRSGLRHARGLRIDHVMGLFRLFWIPDGLGPKHGAYVRYPAEELLAIVAVESHRAGAWVAGEDLGTVEPEVRRRLAESRMLPYRLLWFEDDPPTDYPEQAMAAITTHDLPTVAGLWSGADFAAQSRIGVNPDEASYHKIRDRLTSATELPSDASDVEAVESAYQALAEAPSSVLVANLEDALAVGERPNMPGTIDEWPNWSLALPRNLDEIESSSLPHAIARSLSRSGDGLGSRTKRCPPRR